MTDKLLPCPCGETPDNIGIYDANQGGKWAFAVPSCCNEWHIEFRTHYKALDSEECQDLANKAWNDSPRHLPPKVQAVIDAADELAFEGFGPRELTKLQNALRDLKEG